MKKIILTSILLLFSNSICLGCMENIPKEVQDAINNQKIDGIDNITDQKLIKDLLAYLYFNGNRNYKEVYYYPAVSEFVSQKLVIITLHGICVGMG